MSKFQPVHLARWVEEHRDLLKPPVGNKMVWTDDRETIIMIVGGPNARKDYHVNATEEFFYQIEGDITLKVIRPGSDEPEDVVIREGEIYLLPANVPHSPQRPAGTVGLVIEQKRPAGVRDKLQWYAEDTHDLLWEAEFTLENIEQDLTRIMDTFWSDETLRTNPKTGSVMQKPGPAQPPPAAD